MSRRPEISRAAQPLEPPPLSRILHTDEIGDCEEVTLTATETERKAIAALLGQVSLSSLSFAGKLRREGDARFLLRGTLRSSLTQTCVISLEPVESEIEVPVEIEFWPEERLEAFGERLDEVEGQGLLEWPEPIVDGQIDLGPLIYEVLATSIDPYPRRKDARLDWEGRGSDPGASAPKGPFAALEKLKNRD
jgi:uncharacterized metal-binding protein YceD (DUF177 family)